MKNNERLLELGLFYFELLPPPPPPPQLSRDVTCSRLHSEGKNRGGNVR